MFARYKGVRKVEYIIGVYVDERGISCTISTSIPSSHIAEYRPCGQAFIDVNIM